MKLTGNQIIYLLTIRKLSEDRHIIKSVDIAKQLDYSRASVHKMMKSLKELGLVDQEYYSAVRLTPQGRKKANDYLKKYEVLKDALSSVMKVPDKYLLGICSLIDVM